MPYGLVVNGELRDLGDLKYLLSPQVNPDFFLFSGVLHDLRTSGALALTTG